MSSEWRESAACLGADPIIFHRLSADDPVCKGLTEAERKTLERKNFDKALTFCSSCPVVDECAAEGMRMDFGEEWEPLNGAAFSVWGGAYPTGYSPRKKGRPRKADSYVCVRGHIGERYREANGTPRCRACKREGLNPAREKAPRTVAEKHAAGMYDHDLVASRQGKVRPKLVCLECKRQASAIKAMESPTYGMTQEEIHFLKRGHEPVWRVRPRGDRNCMVCEKARDKLRNKTNV